MMKKKPVVKVLVGYPACGKSTYSKMLKGSYIVLSSDGIRKELYGDEAIQGNPSDIFPLLYARMEDALRHGENVVVDSTNITKWERNNALNIAKKYSDNVIAVVFSTPVEVCKERNRKRVRTVPEFVYDKMAARYEQPTTAEGFTEVEVVQYLYIVCFFEEQCRKRDGKTPSLFS